MIRMPFVLAAIFVLSSFVQAQSNEELKQRIDQLEKQLEQLKAQIGTQQTQAAPTEPAKQTTEETEKGQQEQQQEPPAPAEKKARMELYGFAQLDTGYDAGSTDPQWFDVIRTTKLPAFADQFGKGGNWYAGVRQSRLGVKTWVPTDLGELKTIFEFELFGVGVDAGQTTFRLRHAWGEIGQVGAGQTWSPFMDPDVFPNSLEYWGPPGMVFFRNVQFRWTPYNKNGLEAALAFERPGASADPGTIAGRVAIQNARGRFPAPDFSTHVRWGGKHGHVQLATMLRYMQWDDTAPADLIDTHGNAVGWGVNLSGNYIFNNKRDTARLQLVYGKGIQNYMNDAPVDVGAFATGVLRKPVDGRPLSNFGAVAFLDHAWNDKFTSSVGYSAIDVENSGLQDPSSFSRGEYGLFNIMYTPVKNVMFGSEFQWGRRHNFRDGWTYDDYRVQFGARYNFSWDVFGGKKQ
jgi:hypothetical protein